MFATASWNEVTATYEGGPAIVKKLKSGAAAVIRQTGSVPTLTE
jgi:hypothetical protein